MRLNAGCVAVLFTLVHSFGAKAAKSHRREYDFHVSSLQRDGVRRTVVNGQWSSSNLSLIQWNNGRVAYQVNTQVGTLRSVECRVRMVPDVHI